MDDTLTTPKQEYQPFSEATIAEGFKAFICRDKNKPHEHADEIQALLREYLTKEVPEIAAVTFLRNDFCRPPLVSHARRYEGRYEDGPALDYLRTHYAEDIARKTLTTAALRHADPKLFSAVDGELRKPTNKVHRGLVIGTISLRDERREKWGTILGTSNKKNVIKYAMSLKDQRIPQPNDTEIPPSR